MSPLPPKWKLARLNQLGRWIGGGTPSKANPGFWVTEGIPWVSPKDMKKLYLDDAEDHITKKAVEQSSTNVVAEGSVLVVTRSGILSHTLPVAKALRPLAINQDMKALIPDKEVSSDYVLHALRAMEPRILQECGKSGTTVANLDTDRFLNFQIPLPPLEIQRRLVAQLEGLFARSKSAREELTRVPRLIERYKQAILAAAFRGEMTREWRSNNPNLSARPEITRIENERRELFLGSDGDADAYSPPNRHPAVDLFKVPDTWLWLRAEAVCDFITKGTTPPAAAMTSHIGDVPYIKVYNLTFDASLNFEIDPTFISNDTHNNELQRSKVYPDDVLINIVGPPLGKVSLVPDLWPEWNINQAIAVFRSVPTVNRRFLAFWFLSEQVLNWAVSRSKATAGQSNLTLQICRDMPIPVCSVDEQQQIVQGIESAFTAIDRVAREAGRATELLDRLDHATLAKAFRGELVSPTKSRPDDVDTASNRGQRTTVVRNTIPTPRAKRSRTALTS
jgi:type I restriction enzyme S subunit